MTMQWGGVMPAITTCFKEDLSIDHDFVTCHAAWLIDNGCSGLVVLGSLGEGATLTFEEKKLLLTTCVRAVAGRAPVSTRSLRPSASTKAANPHSPIPSSASMVESRVILSWLT